ncbi:unnamed protein product [Brachionus calyciflorus]|uniref:Integrase p58-like C-terminal domain-containing protein n=1 Tax=Brachionus calyciflorus TaxID=104777 RepID=A0A813QDC5_9BILA|nr:unnamed protein product [Brachionus calyciflorus]
MVRKNTKNKINNFKFYADRNIRPAEYEVGDRVWLLKQSKKKSVSRKLSRKWKGPFTIVKKQNEHNYLIKPDGFGKKRLVHVNKLKKCFSPPENVRYDSVSDNQSQATLVNLTNLGEDPSKTPSKTTKNIKSLQSHQLIDQNGAPMNLPQPSQTDDLQESYWLDQNFLVMLDEEVSENNNSVYQPNYYLKNEIENNLLEKGQKRAPIEVRVDYIKDDRVEKHDLEEFLLENGVNERGGFSRIRTVRSQLNPGMASLFMCMTWPCYHGWLIHTINHSVINRKSYRAYKEGECNVLVAEKMGSMPVPNHIVRLTQNPINETSPVTAEIRPKELEQPPQPNVQVNQPKPTINIYPKVVVHLDADSIFNRLNVGRGRLLNRSALELSRPNTYTQAPAPAEIIQPLEVSDNEEYEVVNEEF